MQNKIRFIVSGLFVLVASFVGVSVADAATVDVTATPGSINSGQSSIINFTAMAGWNDVANVVCTSGGVTYDGSDSFSVSPTVTTTYTVNCSESEGTLSVTGCTIPDGSSSCNAKVTWTTQDLTAGSTAVTKNKPSANTSVSTATSGTNVNSSISYTNNPTTFYLYHNSVEIAPSVSVSAVCGSGSHWDSVGGICTPDTSSLFLNISADPMNIRLGEYSNITWDSNADTCTSNDIVYYLAPPYPFPQIPTSSTKSMTPISLPMTYHIHCVKGAESADRSVTITSKKKPTYQEP